jgi:heat shock protein HslJ
MQIHRLQMAVLLAAGMLLAGCQTGQPTSSTVTNSAQTELIELSGSHWQLVELISSDDAIGIVRPADPTVYQMHLNSNGTANLRLACNRANGPWWSKSAGNGLAGEFTIGPVAMSRAMCSPGSFDQRIGRELQYIRSYTIKDGRLILAMMADGGLQVWEPINDEPK